MQTRHTIKDEDWERIKGLLPGQRGGHGRPAEDNRKFINAVLWIAKTGAPWRDLPEHLGNWNSVWRRFDRWARKGVWQRLFEVLKDPDLEWLIIDSTLIRAHPHAAGARKNADGTGGQSDEALGRSRGGFGTKIHAAVNGLGLPVNLLLTAGQEADINQAENLIQDIPCEAVIGDKGYDSKKFADSIESKGSDVVIPSLSNRKEQREYDKDLYKERNLVERFWSKIKQFRRVATRYEKTARNFLAFVHVASSVVLLN
jgi:transposase